MKLLLTLLSAALTYRLLMACHVKADKCQANLLSRLELVTVEAHLSTAALRVIFDALESEQSARREAQRLLMAWQMFHFARSGDKLKSPPPIAVARAGQGQPKPRTLTLEELLRDE